jgi:hypothetical protein
LACAALSALSYDGFFAREGIEMAEFNRTESMRTESAASIAPGGAVATGILHEAEIWTSAQCELLAGIGTIWADWLSRQREAIDASARSFQQMVECRNLVDVAQLQQQWLADTARRGASDIGSLARDSVALTWRLAGGDRPGGRGQASPMRSAARAKSGDEATVQRAAAE